MNVAFDYEASASSVLEYLLTDHPYRSEVAQLSNQQIERLRAMLHEALELRISPEEIYEAIRRGFDQALGKSVASPPLADDLSEADSNSDKELMEALLREVSPA